MAAFSACFTGLVVAGGSSIGRVATGFESAVDRGDVGRVGGCTDVLLDCSDADLDGDIDLLETWRGDPSYCLTG